MGDVGDLRVGIRGDVARLRGSAPGGELRHGGLRSRDGRGEEECQREGGFLTSDWRSLRLLSLGEEVDNLDYALMCASEGMYINGGR